MTRQLSVRAEHLSKQYEIPREDAPRAADYLRRPAWAFRASRTRSITALHDVSFELHEGEVLGIIGRNGAGKSTLLKVLSRITSPTSGRVEMHGRVASLLEVGTGFHPELTGRENIFLNGMLLGMSSREVSRVYDAICEFASIGPYINVPIKRYSSGMQLRLAFSVAAHLAADTMIIDEVLAVGDAEFQRKCLGAMRDVSRAGRTTLFVSHNMSAIESLCSRVIWLEKGQLRDAGAANEVVRSYLRAGASSAENLPDIIDLGDASRGYQLGGAQLQDISFLRRDTESDQPAWHVDFGEPFALELRFVLDRDTVAPVAAIGFRNDRGEDVLTSHSTDSLVTDHLGAGPAQARVEVAAPWLRPGVYFVEAAVLSGMQLLDYVSDAATLVVHETSAKDAPALGLKKGPVSPVWPWKVEQIR
jgi:lipopolysaccharide transport system ATP-binding protein